MLLAPLDQSDDSAFSIGIAVCLVSWFFSFVRFIEMQKARWNCRLVLLVPDYWQVRGLHFTRVKKFWPARIMSTRVDYFTL